VQLEAVKISAALAARARAKQADRTARIKSSAQGEVEYHLTQLKRATERLAGAEEEARSKTAEWVEALARLTRAGFKPETNDYDCDIQVNIKKRQFKRLYRAIGRLDPKSLYKEVAWFGSEQSTDTVLVTIRGAQFPCVVLHFHVKLKKTDRCRIVTTEVPARTNVDLVCEVN
jgi:hypothetical protein